MPAAKGHRLPLAAAGLMLVGTAALAAVSSKRPARRQSFSTAAVPRGARQRRGARVFANALAVGAVALVATSVFVARSEPTATKGVVQLAAQSGAGHDAITPLLEPAVVADSGEERMLPPQHLSIDAIGVSVATVPVGLAPDGSLAVPEPGNTGWYEPGVRPGEAGYAVIAGHVDSYRGPDVFYKLRDLQPGAEIVVRDQAGTNLTFVVESVEQQAKDALPTSRMWQRSSRPMLALITCGGAFDRKQRTYLDNVVVYAALAAEPAASPATPRG